MNGMNKETFLNELSSRLQVLKEQERNDLLEEYAQHIDLKTANGLSEEEAVRDFGSIDELCAELLEVYHIDSSYAAGKVSQSQSEEQETEKTLADKAGKVLKIIKAPKIAKEKTDEQIAMEQEQKVQRIEEQRAKAEERRLLYAQKREEQKQKHLVRKEIQKEKREERRKEWEVFCERRRQERSERRERNGGSLLRKICSGIGRLTVFLAVLFWKCCLFGAAAPFVIVALFALFCTGTVGVLLREGYPLIGITLLCGGAFLASAGVSGLLLSFVFAKKKGVVQDEKIQN